MGRWGDPVLHPQLGQPVHDLHRLQTHRHDPLDQIDDVLGIVGPIVGIYRAWKPRSPVAVCEQRFIANMVEVLIRDWCGRNIIAIPEQGAFFDEDRWQPVQAPAGKRWKG